MSYEKDWNAKLFGCFDDCKSCLCGTFCSPCLFGQNAEKTDGSNCLACCCAYYLLGGCYLCWVPQMIERKKLREKYGLKEEPCGDCPTTFCCGPCALCQEARELKSKEPGASYNVNNGPPIVQQPGGYSHNAQPNVFYNNNSGPPQSGYYTDSNYNYVQPNALNNINYGQQMGYNPDPNNYNMYPNFGQNNYANAPVHQQGAYSYNI